MGTWLKGVAAPNGQPKQNEPNSQCSKPSRPSDVRQSDAKLKPNPKPPEEWQESHEPKRCIHHWKKVSPNPQSDKENQGQRKNAQERYCLDVESPQSGERWHEPDQQLDPEGHGGQ